MGFRFLCGPVDGALGAVSKVHHLNEDERLYVRCALERADAFLADALERTRRIHALLPPWTKNAAQEAIEIVLRDARQRKDGIMAMILEGIEAQSRPKVLEQALNDLAALCSASNAPIIALIFPPDQGRSS